MAPPDKGISNVKQFHVRDTSFYCQSWSLAGLLLSVLVVFVATCVVARSVKLVIVFL